MKTLLTCFNNSFFVRNFLRTEIASTLLRSGKVQLVLLAPGDKLAYYRKEFGRPGLVFDVLPDVSKFWSERIFKFMETSSIHTHTVTMMQRTDFIRDQGHKSVLRRSVRYAAGRALWFLGRFRLWRSFLRRLYVAFPSDDFGPYLRRYRPNLVYCPAMLYFDARLLKEAKKAGIPTIGMMLSWDNLYSKTFLRAHPDLLMAHTDVIREQAIQFGDFPGDRIVVTGIPQYDNFFRRSGVVGREEFIGSLGGDPSKNLIVYAFSGKAGLSIEFEMIEMLGDAISKGEIQNVEVLVRPYPKFEFPESRLQKWRNQYGFLARQAVEHVGSGKQNWEFDDAALKLLANTLEHADVVISMYSTFLIEAALFGKPLIAIAFDGAKKRSYWDSTERFFEWDHLREVKELNGIWIAQSGGELIRAINTYLAHPEYMAEGRARIVERQSQFTDGRSAERVARVIGECLESYEMPSGKAT